MEGLGEKNNRTTSRTTNGQEGSGRLRQQQQMQDEGPRPKGVAPKKRTAPKTSPNEEKTVAALTAGSEQRSTWKPHGERLGHTRQRQESDELWLCVEQWRWTCYGKPHKRKRMSHDEGQVDVGGVERGQPCPQRKTSMMSGATVWPRRKASRYCALRWSGV
eukprot:6211779-Pleurochrysis_carterae.AAC.4